ncbi:serine hydrolase, partial [Ectothiorhodospira sp. PHS-1]|uniref:serine hydrolase domain-containing protein n=1 Tax=Ectothiorhodospira sp. PHS-1 TaxID=519989 RepID=UPI0006830A75
MNGVLRNWYLLAILPMFFVASLPSGGTTVANGEPLQQAREYTASLLGDDPAPLWPLLGEDLRDVLGDVEGLRAVSRQLRDEFGSEQEILEERVSPQGGGFHYLRLARHERGDAPLAIELFVSDVGVIETLLASARSVLTLAPPLESPPLEPGRLPADDWIEALLQRAAMDMSLPSIVVGIRDADGRRFIAVGDTGDGRAPDEHTVFEVGSITKGLTGLLLARLIADGDVRADQPIGGLFPEDIPLSPRLAAITLEELATHHSGLSRLGTGPEMSARLSTDNPYAGSSVAEIFRDTAAVPDKAVEARHGYFAYSNLGMALLGQLLARATATDYPTLLDERVMTPLALGPLLLDPNQVRGRRAEGSRNGQPAASWHMDAYAPAGGWQASAAQLLELGERLLTDEPAWVADALRPRRSGGGEGIGLAWLHGSAGGRRIIWHNGGTGGFRSHLVSIPEERLVLVVLSNGVSELAPIVDAI